MVRYPNLEVPMGGPHSKVREPMGSTSKITLRTNFEILGVFSPKLFFRSPEIRSQSQFLEVLTVSPRCTRCRWIGISEEPRPSKLKSERISKITSNLNISLKGETRGVCLRTKFRAIKWTPCDQAKYTLIHTASREKRRGDDPRMGGQWRKAPQ
jgi:hypothetical protein